ncbi:ABC-type amino acid transport/signal transduction system, periplasmic component/domain [hydrothermal vent metagenome]|uniref:ABC-type amino acid transport/signal transduction system, periplasmic component/domain n=1 Tax=hydrothermal vent metagenome TaxID=652676 RepID=A0A3B0TE67_9ZZZZ
MFRFLSSVILAMSVATVGLMPAIGYAAEDDDTFTSDWGGREMEPRGGQIRFLTDSDYPPFNYYDEDGQLTGFNIDVARAVCEALGIVCSIEPRAWSELLPRLEAGDADAVIASLAITTKNRAKVQFTDPYYRIPARFVVRSDTDIQDVSPRALATKRIAVVKGTSHEAYLRSFFSGSTIVTYETETGARSALRFGKVDALFGDGVNMMFWLNGASSRRCCAFRGGAYTESRFFTEGVGIAVAKGNDELAAMLSKGLVRIRKNGSFEELLLRYFPMSLY